MDREPMAGTTSMSWAVGIILLVGTGNPPPLTASLFS
jgi:hypothetical protein